MIAVLTAVYLPTVKAFTPGVGSEALLGSFIVVTMLMLSVFLHELAHAFAARAFGFKVHELALTLWGGHTSFSESRSTPLSTAVISAVGPLTNVVLAASAWWIYQTQSFASNFALLLVFTTAYANAMVAAFNLLPGLPLDGGQVTKAIIWAISGRQSTGTAAAAWTGRVLAVVLVAGALVVPTLRGDQVQFFTVAAATLIGSFMWSSAGAALRVGKRQGRVEGLDPHLLARPAAALDESSSTADVVELVARRQATHPDSPVVVVLVAHGRPTGYVDPEALASVPVEQLAATAAWSVAVRLPASAAINADLHGAELYDAIIAAAPLSVLFVLVSGAQVVGVLHASDVVRAVHLD